MKFRKSLAPFAAIALISSAVVSVPAIAQDSDNGDDDASMWVAGAGIVAAAILGIVLASKSNGNNVPTPISP